MGISPETAVGALAVLLLFVIAFLAMAETSLSRIDRFRAQALVDDGRRGSAPLWHLVSSPEKFSGFLNSLLLLLLAAQITASTAVAYLALRWFSTPIFVVSIVAEVLVGYVIAEAMPKTFAVQHTERAALFTAPIIAGLARIIPMRLLTRPLIWSANLLLPGKGLAQGPFVYEQQILALADSAAQDAAIERDEHRLIHSVIEFRSTIAREVMVPRPDMITVAAKATVREAMKVAIDEGFSRFPVHGEESDEITGMLYTKDLMRFITEGNGEVLVAGLMREAKYIPETKRVAELMSEMQREKMHISIVIDEYGSVVGLVTLEDLIEEVVGEISDEYDVEELPRVRKVGEEWDVDARMHVDEVYEETGLRLPLGDWDTVGGLLINAFGRVPSRGDCIEVDGYSFAVEQVSGRRVTRARVGGVGAAAEANAQAQSGNV